jgi:hypothetical protein
MSPIRWIDRLAHSTRRETMNSAMKKSRLVMGLWLVACCVAVTGCAGGKYLEAGKKAEDRNDPAGAYEHYCRAAAAAPDSSTAADGLARTRVGAAAYWERLALGALDDGKTEDAWRMLMRTLEIQPDHATAAQLLRQMEQVEPQRLALVRSEYIRRGPAMLRMGMTPKFASAVPEESSDDEAQDTGSESESMPTQASESDTTALAARPDQDSGRVIAAPLKNQETTTRQPAVVLAKPPAPKEMPPAAPPEQQVAQSNNPSERQFTRGFSSTESPDPGEMKVFKPKESKSAAEGSPAKTTEAPAAPMSKVVEPKSAPKDIKEEPLEPEDLQAIKHAEPKAAGDSKDSRPEVARDINPVESKASPMSKPIEPKSAPVNTPVEPPVTKTEKPIDRPPPAAERVPVKPPAPEPKPVVVTRPAAKPLVTESRKPPETVVEVPKKVEPPPARENAPAMPKSEQAARPAPKPAPAPERIMKPSAPRTPVEPRRVERAEPQSPPDNNPVEGEDSAAVIPGHFISVHTYSKKDERFPRRGPAIDGINLTLRDTDETDGTVEVDLDLEQGHDRIKKIRDLRVGRTQSFRGASGKIWRLTILSAHQKTHTVRIGFRGLGQ